jgi:nucleotide-binding universal stress UspA family protein
MFRTILAPLDGTPFGEQALPLALTVAKKSGASLLLVHVEPALSSDQENQPAAESEQQVQHAYLRAVAAKLEACYEVKTTFHEPHGAVADAICHEALAEHVDLVVMSTHGRGPLGRIVYGSVTDALIRRLPIPLLLWRAQTNDCWPGLNCDFPLKRILLPLDGTMHAERIFEPALELGRTMESEYTLLQVVEPLPYVGPGVAAPAFSPAILERVNETAADYLKGAAQRLRAKGFNVEGRTIVNPGIPATILEEAKTGGYDLIALATHGRGGIGRLLLGSIAERILCRACTPVLLFPTIGQELEPNVPGGEVIDSECGEPVAHKAGAI